MRMQKQDASGHEGSSASSDRISSELFTLIPYAAVPIHFILSRCGPTFL